MDLALCISRFIEEDFRKRFPGVRTFVMNPCIIPSPVTGVGNRAALTRMVRAPLERGPVLLAVARLVRRKGIGWFVAEVLPEIPNGTLVIVGDGPERPAIADTATRAGVSGRVVFAGKLTGEGLQTVYRSADLLVMPNIPVPGDAEGFGLVALEAAAAGLPVIAANLEGIPDAIVDGETGVLVPPQDAGAWVAAIRRLLDHPEERQRIARAAPAVIHDRFNWNTRAGEVLRAFADLAAPKKV